MIVFDTPTLTNASSVNPPMKVTTLSAASRSFSVSNYSHFFLKVESDTRNGFGELPPFTTQTFTCRPGQQVTFTIEFSVVPAQQQVSEKVTYTESTLETATGLQSLNIPVYATSVLAERLKVDPSSGFYAGSATSKKVSFTNTIAYYEIFNLDTQGRTVFLNFNSPATGGNADFRLLPDPNKQGQGAVYQTPADYNSFYYLGGDLQVMAWYKDN